jgi:hypothetical protein
MARKSPGRAAGQEALVLEGLAPRRTQKKTQPPRQFSSKPGRRQEWLNLYGHLFIPNDYDLGLAGEMAEQRQERKVPQELQMVRKRTSKVLKGANGLFIPRSEAEVSALLKSPQAQVVLTHHLRVNNVKEKFAGDESVTLERARGWGKFAAAHAVRQTHGRHYNYIIGSWIDFTDLCQAFEPGDHVYNGGSVRESAQAVGGVKRYITNLRLFNADNRTENQTRQWLQKLWVHKIAEARAIADTIFDDLSDHELEGIYREAVFNAWSRGYYWKAVDYERWQHNREVDSKEPDFVEVPMSVYEASAEAYWGR